MNDATVHGGKSMVDGMEDVLVGDSVLARSIDDPDRWLVIGPDRAANLLEVVVVTTVEETQLVIHAMPMRARFRRLLAP